MKQRLERCAVFCVATFALAVLSLVGVLALAWAERAFAQREYTIPVALFSPVLALVLCVAALVIARKRSVRKWPAVLSVSGIFAAGIGIVVILSLLGVFSDGYRRPPSLCKRRLKQIGLAILTYQSQHDEMMPPDLQTLLAGGYVKDKEAFLCEGSRTRRLDRHAVDASSSWYYARGADLPGGPFPPTMPLLWARKTWHTPYGVNVLFADGHVSFTALADLRKCAGRHADLYDKPPVLPEVVER